MFSSGIYISFLPVEAKKLILLITVLGTLILPLVFVPLYLLQRLISSVKMENRNERLIPYFLTAILYFFSFYLIQRTPVPGTLKTWSLATALIVLLAAISNLKFKISAHMMGWGGLTGLIFFLAFFLGADMYFYFILVFLLSGLAAFSRLYLRAHTPGEVYIGYLLGLGTVLGTMLI